MTIGKDITPASLHSIAFHGHELQSWKDERTGIIYGALRPIVEAMGLAWSSQLQRLKRDALYADRLSVFVVNTEAGPRETVGLDLELLPMFLASINRARVKGTLQPTLLIFQRECAKVLADYWTRGVAINPRSAEVTGPWDMLAKMVESGRQQAIEIAVLKDEQTRQRDEQLQQQAEIIKTQDMALMALRSQQWLSIRQHCVMYNLSVQMPEALQNDYGRWLRGYCAEKGIPVYKIMTADRQWREENTYPSQVIADTLNGWLMRRSGQQALTILPAADEGHSMTHDPGVAYTPRRRGRGRG